MLVLTVILFCCSLLEVGAPEIFDYSYSATFRAGN